jgi:hypothetical protein
MLAKFGLCAGFIMALVMPTSDPCTCLPKDIERLDVVSVQNTRPGGPAGKKITVEQKLSELKARCRKGRLVDASGKEIYFYHLQGCWGNPPADSEDVLKQQASELERLRRRYRVIEMTCNPDGMQPY